MKKLKDFGIWVLILMMPFGVSFSQDSKQIFKETFSPRHTNLICPPDYRTAQEQLEWYLEGSNWVIGPDLKHLIKDFDLQEFSIVEFEVLRDEYESRECECLNVEFSRLINQRIQMFEGVDPEYLYDISYYRAQGFYFVVIGGGILIQEDPRNPEVEAFHGGHAAGKVFIFDKDWNQVYSRQIREMIERGEIKMIEDKARE